MSQCEKSTGFGVRAAALQNVYLFEMWMGIKALCLGCPMGIYGNDIGIIAACTIVHAAMIHHI
jgi:hypothetical protein